MNFNVVLLAIIRGEEELFYLKQNGRLDNLDNYNK
jgi:hypothetical protein